MQNKRNITDEEFEHLKNQLGKIIEKKMKHKSNFTGIILLCLSIIQIKSHPTYNDQNIDNRVLTEYSNDVVSFVMCM